MTESSFDEKTNILVELIRDAAWEATVLPLDTHPTGNLPEGFELVRAPQTWYRERLSKALTHTDAIVVLSRILDKAVENDYNKEDK